MIPGPFALANHHIGLYYRLAHLTVAFKIIAIDFECCIYQVSFEEHQTIYIYIYTYVCVGSFSFANGQQAIGISKV